MNTIEATQQLGSPPSKWITIGVKVRKDDVAILNKRLHVFGYESMGGLTRDFIVGKFPQVTDDKQIETLNKNLQNSGQSTAMSIVSQPTFYKAVKYEDLLNFYTGIKKLSQEYSKGLARYFKYYAEVFFTQPEELLKLPPRKRAWVLDAMRGFGRFWVFHTKGNEEVEDVVRKIIKRYNLNSGLDNKDKVYLVDDNYLANSIDALTRIQGELGFILRLGLLSGLRERELEYAYKRSICPKKDGCSCELIHTAEKGTLTVVVLNRFEGSKKAYFTIMPTSTWKTFRSLPRFSHDVEIRSAHNLLKKTLDMPYRQLRKIHWNVLRRTMETIQADILAGRANSVSARHYLLNELDEMAKEYLDAWKGFDVVV